MEDEIAEKKANELNVANLLFESIKTQFSQVAQDPSHKFDVTIFDKEDEIKGEPMSAYKKSIQQYLSEPGTYDLFQQIVSAKSDETVLFALAKVIRENNLDYCGIEQSLTNWAFSGDLDLQVKTRSLVVRYTINAMGNPHHKCDAKSALVKSVLTLDYSNFMELVDLPQDNETIYYTDKDISETLMSVVKELDKKLEDKEDLNVKPGFFVALAVVIKAAQYYARQTEYHYGKLPFWSVFYDIFVRIAPKKYALMTHLMNCPFGSVLSLLEKKTDLTLLQKLY